MPEFVTNPADGSGSPAHAPGAVVPTSHGLAPVLPSTEGLTGDQCRAQYRELMSPEKMQAMGRMTPGARNAEIAKGEALMKRAAELDTAGKAPGKPAAAATGPRYVLDAGLSVEQKAAATALAEREVALIDAGPEGLAEIDAMHEPKAANEYANLHHGAGRQMLLEHGVSPIAANFLIQQAITYPENDDAAYDVLADKAVDLVRRQPGGAKVLADAKKFLDSLKDNSPLLASAVMAAAYPTGIAELARLHRRGARAAR